MLRKYLILMSAVLAVSISAAPAVAGDIPCPVVQLVNETRVNNEKQGKGMPDPFYQRLAENYRKQCSRAEKKISTYTELLKEYREGNRDDRDGYVILQTLYNSYGVLRAVQTPNARAIREQLDALVKKHPDFPNMQNFQLSEGIAAEKKQVAERKGHAAKLANWTPRDSVPVALIVSSKYVVAKYQYRLAFYSRPSDAKTVGTGRRKKLIRATVSGADQEIPLSTLTPIKILTFQQVIDVYPPNHEATSDTHLLVCTTPSSSYSATTDEESKLLENAGHRYGTMKWVDPSGQYRDFCGVISQAGSVIFKFPLTQHGPDAVLMPLGIADNGTRAAVALGEQVIEDGEDGPSEHVGKIREVLIWESNALRSVKKFPPFNNTNELADLFINRKL